MSRMNPVTALKLKKIANDFSSLHPKFAEFMQTNYLENLQEGTIIKVVIQPPDGEASASAMKVKKSDIRLVEDLKNL